MRNFIESFSVFRRTFIEVLSRFYQDYLEQTIRDNGAIPATIAIIGGDNLAAPIAKEPYSEVAAISRCGRGFDSIDSV